MTVLDIISQQAHDDDLEKEVQNGYIEQTEEEEPGRTEVEGEQTVPFHQWQRVAMEFFAYLCRHITGTAVFLSQQRHETLELRGGLLLLAGIVDV